MSEKKNKEISSSLDKLMERNNTDDINQFQSAEYLDEQKKKEKSSELSKLGESTQVISARIKKKDYVLLMEYWKKQGIETPAAGLKMLAYKYMRDNGIIK